MEKEVKKNDFFIIKKTNLKNIKGGAPGCHCWWDVHSECRHATGCITSSHNSITMATKSI